MTDYISRQAAIEIAYALHSAEKDMIEKGFNSIPAADVRENVRGEWIYTEEDKGQIYPIIKCSICGHYVGGEWNYCPNCGADMRTD